MAFLTRMLGLRTVSPTEQFNSISNTFDALTFAFAHPEITDTQINARIARLDRLRLPPADKYRIFIATVEKIFNNVAPVNLEQAKVILNCFFNVRFNFNISKNFRPFYETLGRMSRTESQRHLLSHYQSLIIATERRAMAEIRDSMARAPIIPVAANAFRRATAGVGTSSTHATPSSTIARDDPSGVRPSHPGRRVRTRATDPTEPDVVVTPVHHVLNNITNNTPPGEDPAACASTSRISPEPPDGLATNPSATF